MAITNASKLASYVGAAITADGASGIITATQFVGDGSGLTGIAVTDNVNTSTLVVAGVSTLNGATNLNSNVTISGNITSVTDIFCNSLVNYAGGGPTFGLYNTGNANFNGTVTAQGFSGTTAAFTGNVTIGGTLTYEDVTNIDSIGLITARDGLQVLSGISTFSGKINANSGVGFTGFLREGINIVSGKLSDNVTVNVDHSMVHYFTTAETTTSIPNITSTAGINTDLSTGESFSVNILTTAAAAGYSTGARIDAGATLPVLWNGGSDPSEGGASGLDVYTFQVIKTADATFTVLGNVSNFA